METNDEEERKSYTDRPIPQKKKGFGIAFSGLMTFLFTLVMQVIPSIIGIIIIVVILLPKMKDQPEGSPPLDLLSDPQAEKVLIYVLMFSHVLGLCFTLLLLQLRYGSSWTKRIYAFRRPSLTHLILLLVSVPALLTFFGVFEATVLPHIPSFKDLGFPGLTEFMETIKRLPLGLAILAIAVLPALNEELFCRGFLNSGVIARYGSVVSVIWVSFLFGAMHLEPPQALFAILFGVVIHLVYLASRSLPLAMLLHFVNNALVVSETKGQLQTFFAPMKTQIETNPSLAFAASTLVLLVLGFFFYKTRIRAEQVT